MHTGGATLRALAHVGAATQRSLLTRACQAAAYHAASGKKFRLARI